MVVRPNLDTTLALALSPLLALQTLWVRAHVLRLPEPDGARSGQSGSGEALKLLVIGDSSAAGVGVPVQDEALTPKLASLLGQNHSIHWRLSARNGATSADVPELLNNVSGQNFDLVLAILGVNDAKNLRSESSWRRNVTGLITGLRTHHGTPKIFFSGLPRVQDFPLLPHPLKTVFALRVQRFDRALQEVMADHPDCYHLPIDVLLSETGMAPDGFHPGAPIYTHWAQVAARGIAPHL